MHASKSWPEFGRGAGGGSGRPGAAWASVEKGAGWGGQKSGWTVEVWKEGDDLEVVLHYAPAPKTGVGGKWELAETEHIQPLQSSKAGAPGIASASDAISVTSTIQHLV